MKFKKEEKTQQRRGVFNLALLIPEKISGNTFSRNPEICSSYLSAPHFTYFRFQEKTVLVSTYFYSFW
jgi:hypothetical protein